MSFSPQLVIDQLRRRVAELEGQLDQRRLPEPPREINEALARFCPVPAWISFENRIIFVNEPAVKAFGARSSSEIVGNSPLDFSFPEGDTRAEVTERSFPYAGGTAIFHALSVQTSSSEDEARLASIIQFSNDAIIGEGLDGTVLSWNRAAQRIFGYEAAEILGRPSSLLVPAGCDEDGSGHFESTGVRKDGRQIDLLVTVSPVKDAEGSVIGASKIVRDISVKKRGDELIQRQIAELETMCDAVPVALGLADLEHRYVRVNGKLADLNGVPAADHIGRRVRDVIPDLAPLLEPVLKQVAASGEPVRIELPLRTPDHPEVERYFLAGYYPVKSANGAVLGVGAVVQDITPLKTAEDELRRTAQQLETVLASIQDPFVMLDHDWRFTYANSHAAEATEERNQELSGKYLFDVFAKFGADFEAAVRRAKAEGATVRISSQEPSGRCFESVVYPSAQGVSILFRDVTALEKAKRKKRENENIYRAIGESVDYGVWVCDAAGRNAYVSDSFLKLVGLSQNDCSGYGWMQALRPQDVASTLAQWNACVWDGRNWDAEHWFRGVDGRWHPVLSRGAPVRNEAGEIISWAGIHLDISAFKEAQELLQGANETLERANRELEQFAYTASHDLQEPLRVIRLMAHLIARRYNKIPDEDGEKYVLAIDESAGRMSSLVHDLLDYARMLHSAIEPDQVSDLNAALQVAIQTCQSRIDDSFATIKYAELPSTTSVAADMARVFQNLIVNAIKYSRKPAPEIEITVDRRGPEWRFCVADHGQGVPRDQAQAIFQPFKRLHGIETPGSGLGLAVCKKIVERHGGRIWVESDPGRGSHFYFTLPVD